MWARQSRNQPLQGTLGPPSVDLLSCAHGARVSFSVPDFEQRLSHLQAQLDRLEHLPPGEPGRAEQRLSLLADQFAELLRRWSVLSERQTRAASRLESDLGEWNAAGIRLQDDTAKRLVDLDTRLQREWQELRERYEAPVRRLHEDAASLTQVTIATASSAQQHFERSEARLCAIEDEIGRRLAELSRVMQGVSADIQAFRRQSPDPATEAPPLAIASGVASSDADSETVVPGALLPEPANPEALEDSRSATERFTSLERAFAEQDAERRGSEAAPATSPAVDALSERLTSLERALAEQAAERAGSLKALAKSASAIDTALERIGVVERTLGEGDRASAVSPSVDGLMERFTALERVLGERGAEMREVSQQVTRDVRVWRVAAALFALLALGSGVFAWSLRRDVKDATQLAEEVRRDRGAITDSTERELAATRDTAARELKDAVEQTARARMISEVLAAPDVVRYDLVGRDTLTGAAAQLRWSRSRGLVFSGSRIPSPPADSAYQLWLVTRAGAIRAATFTPDDTGSVTIAAPLPQAPGAIIGAMVTTEPAAGSEAPSGSPVLARQSEPATVTPPDKPDAASPVLR